MTRPRLLIEDWLPAAAIGVECMRERGSASALAPHTYLHVWWARRPLCASRAAVLGSLLPADFPRDVFERLLGFGRPARELVELRRIMDSGKRLGGFGCDRAFKHSLREDDLEQAHSAARKLFSSSITVIDPMAGGGSIPLESARLGFHTLANEYNPVACTVLEATVNYPFRYGARLADRARHWGKELRSRFVARVERFFPKTVHNGLARPDGYIFARTVPCPDTERHPHTPLVPDWHLIKPKDSDSRIWAEPVVNKKAGNWTVRIVESKVGSTKGDPPKPNYKDGKGISLFTGLQIADDYIKAKAQAGEMRNALYAIVVKTNDGLKFQMPSTEEFAALAAAEKELTTHRAAWEKAWILPTELFPEVCTDDRPRQYGMPRWADLFAPRQLLCFATLVEELQKLRTDIVKQEGKEIGNAVIHLLAMALDKFANYNSVLSSWHAPRSVIRSVFDRHDFSFKATFTELACCNSRMGIDWAIDNTLEAFEHLAELPRDKRSNPVNIALGSATNLPAINDKSITAVVVDPPYADNVQYSELADFFYVWLKRTQGHCHPEWFSTYLCEHDQEAVVNIERHRDGEQGKKGGRDGSAKEARKKARAFYQRLMTETFVESRRILRDDGVLTVMFTHKKQEAWEALFSSLIDAGFTITATWPVKTESEHSLHQAKKNAAQSTVILVARKRDANAGIGYWDEKMRSEIRDTARKTAARLAKEGLNPVDQLVGSFGPAMEVYSQYDDVRTDTGMEIRVDKAIDEASDAVSKWRIEQLSERGLEGVEAEGRFALLCWDVLGAAEFRFNEAKLLGNAVGMDVASLEAAGLVVKSGDKIRILPARERRRERALEPDEVVETLFGPVTSEKKRTKKQALRVHPNDPRFRTTLDACHALALRYVEAGGGSGGIGSAKALAVQQRWGKDSSVARLMEALVHAASPAVRFDKGKKSAGALFPEFRAWHALLPPLFGVSPPEWKEEKPAQAVLFDIAAEAESDEDEEEDSEEQ